MRICYNYAEYGNMFVGDLLNRIYIVREWDVLWNTYPIILFPFLEESM